MRRAIFADTDAVMREDVRDRNLHECSQTNHRLRIITEDEERAYIRTQAAMQRDAVGNCCHSQLTHTEMQIAARIVHAAEISFIVHMRLVGWCKVCAAANELRHDILQAVDHDAGKIAGSLRLVFISPESFIAEQCFSIQRCMEFFPKLLCFREFRTIVSKELVPFLFCCFAFLRKLLIMRIDLCRNIEGLFRFRPAKVFLQCLDVLLTERLAMCTGFALFCRAAKADLRLDRDKGRTLFVCLRLFDGLADCSNIIAIFYGDRLETKCFHTLLDIFREGNIGIALDGNLVAVI